MNKKFYLSKTLWFNLAMIAQLLWGPEIVSDHNVGVAMGVINLILRSITKEPVVWS